MIEILIPGLKLASTNQSLRGTTIGARMAAAGKAKRERTGINMLLRGKFGKAPEPPMVITITRLGPRELDDDNLAGSAKHLRDGIADWLGVNDRDKRLKWVYVQEKTSGRPSVYGVRVRVEHTCAQEVQ